MTRLLGAFGIYIRMIKTLLLRQVSAFRARFHQLTNFSRIASQAATDTVKQATNTAKPSKREDYFRVAGLLVSKAFVLRVVVVTAAVVMLAVFVVWPFVLSRFLTARFWREDKRVSGWTGQVIVYADRKKSIPLYAGRLEKGRLQGRGEEYDENGILAYRGDFVDGARTGTGSCWRENVLIYEGELTNGVYQGHGQLHMEDGGTYTGQFENGVFQGTGRLTYLGIRRYEGSFEKNRPEGQGRSYNAAGRLIYEGDYAAGEYSGTGAYYPAEGEKLEAEFQAGVPVGSVRWFRNGQLYYEGEWADGRPSGLGKLYDRAGRVVYQGRFALGTIDGASLLGLTAEELRGMLDEKHTVSVVDPQGGFRLTDAELGLTAQCSLRTEEQESRVLRVSLAAPDEEDSWLRLLPGQDLVLGWPEDAETSRVDRLTGSGGHMRRYREITANVSGAEVKAYFPAEEAVSVRIVWTAPDRAAELPADPFLPPQEGAVDSPAAAGTAAGDGAGAADSPAGDMAALLDALDTMQDAGIVRLNAEKNPYYGDADPAEAITQSASPEAAGSLLDAMTDYWLLAQRQEAAEKQLLRCNALLDTARQEAALGMDRETAVAALEERQILLSAEIESCITSRKELSLLAEGQAALEKYDLSQVPALFDPGSLDVEQLALVSAAYRQMRTGKDAEGIENEVKSMLLTLQDDWTAVQTQKKLCELALASLRRVAGSFSLGVASREDWYAALDASSSADIACKTAVAAFEKHANQLNQAAAGWLSRNCGWHAEELRPVYLNLLAELDETTRALLEEQAQAEREAQEQALREAIEQAREEAESAAADGEQDEGKAAESAGTETEGAESAEAEDSAGENAGAEAEAGEAEEAKGPPETEARAGVEDAEAAQAETEDEGK